ncbi:YciI family protein [Amycolatopsis sp. NPDC004747]
MAMFAILIYEDFGPGGWADAPAEVLEAHGGFAAKVEELGGKVIEGQALLETPQAKSIRGGEVSDGPYVDTKEELLAYNVVEARDLDHAVEIAKFCPVSKDGGVEVRPVLA